MHEAEAAHVEIALLGRNGKWFVHLESGGKTAALQIFVGGVHPRGQRR